MKQVGQRVGSVKTFVFSRLLRERHPLLGTGWLYLPVQHTVQFWGKTFSKRCEEVVWIFLKRQFDQACASAATKRFSKISSSPGLIVMKSTMIALPFLYTTIGGSPLRNR